MAKRRKKGLSGLGDIPRELKPVVPGDLKTYQIQKTAFRDELKNRRCPMALDLLANAAGWAGTARARAVASGTDGGAEELAADVSALRQEYLKVCLDWTDADSQRLRESAGFGKRESTVELPAKKKTTRKKSA